MWRTAVILFWLALACGAAGAEEQAKGFLGAELADVTQEEAAKLGWETPRGAKVVKLADGSPAAAAGLQPGDIAVTLDGVEIENAAGFDRAIGSKEAGAAVKLRLLRGGKERMVSGTLAANPAGPKTAANPPVPMLDTGGHMAEIRALAFTPDGSQIVSASDDKTIRVWDVSTGKTVRVIRGEVGAGPAGAIYAMALSPDGKWLAAGGWTASGAIRLYDFAGGKLVVLLQGHEDAVLGLAFSPDGQYLISGGHDQTAIVWDVAARKIKHRLKGHRDIVTAVGFTSDSARAVTGSDNHELRLWSVETGDLLKIMTGHRDKVVSLTVAPNGTIASGDLSGEIRLWDGWTGNFLRSLAQQKGDIGSLSISPDGKAVLSGAAEPGGPYICHVHDVADGYEIATYKAHDNIVYATAISPDGRWAATAGGNNKEIHIWDLRTGVRRQGADARPLKLGGAGRSVRAVGFSADGGQIAWGNSGGRDDPMDRGPLEQVLTLPISAKVLLPAPQALAPEAAKSYRRATASKGTWSLSRRQGGTYHYDAILDIKEGEAVRTSIERNPGDGWLHDAYSFTPSGEVVISGGANGWLAEYALDGTRRGNFIGHQGDVWAVVPSPDGKYLLSGSDDQTVRLWNLKTRELLVTLFQGTDGEWVMWTPQGYYAASGPGSELIGWQINHSPDHEAEYVTAAQLRKSLNRPDIVARAIELASAEAAVKEAYGTNFKLSDLLAKPVPRLRIVSPATNATLTGGTAQLELALEETPAPVNLIRLYVNGTQVDARQPEDGPGFKPGPLTFSVPLAKGRNLIRAVAVNETGETSAEVAVTLHGEGVLDKRGTLRILAIGVNNYPGLGMACRELDGITPRSCDLSAAVSDAAAFANAMAARLGPLHEHVVSAVLVNGAKSGEPKAANIIDALDELRRAQPNDTILMFVSGHGFQEDQDYYFVPTDAEFAGGRLRKSTAVPWAQFQGVLEGANGRRFLFLDTCRSGNRYSQRLTNEAHEQNIVVYAAARWDQDALERSDLGGGLFTYALVEGVKGAAKDKAGEVRAKSLRDYVQGRVKELAKPLGFEQEPQYFPGRDAQDYLLAVGK